MANKEISGLTAAAALAGADLFIASQGGNSRKATGAQVQSLAGAHPGFVAGRWYTAGSGTIVNGTSVAQQNIINLAPFYLSQPVTISDLGVRVTTAAASSNVQLAIYSSDPTTHKPTGNALAVTGNIVSTSTGALSADITGANVTLAPGLYWMASNMDTSAVQLQGAYSTNQAIYASLIGSTTLANITSGGTSVGIWLQVTQSFGTWPDLTSATFVEVTGACTCAMLFMKAA